MPYTRTPRRTCWPDKVEGRFYPGDTPMIGGQLMLSGIRQHCHIPFIMHVVEESRLAMIRYEMNLFGAHEPDGLMRRLANRMNMNRRTGRIREQLHRPFEIELSERPGWVGFGSGPFIVEFHEMYWAY